MSRRNMDCVEYAPGVDVPAVLASGVGVVTYCGYLGARRWAATVAPDADVWYTERNGDPIVLLVAAGTPREIFPLYAQWYAVFEWIRPEDDFTGKAGPHCWSIEGTHGR